MAILDNRGTVLAGYLLAAYVSWLRGDTDTHSESVSLWLSDAMRILDPCQCGNFTRRACAAFSNHPANRESHNDRR